MADPVHLQELKREGPLKKGCVCGHDHKTARDEPIDLCLDCSCMGWTPRCQNCGEEVPAGAPFHQRFDVCSRRCLAQLDYWATRRAA